MIYYETGLVFLILLTIIPFVIGFFFKNKYVRYFCWLICLPFLGITISTISKHSSDVDKQTEKYLGLYQIDTTKSIYKGGDLTKYHGLSMTVKPNNSFAFSDSSMFPSVIGTWRFYSTEDGGFVRCTFSDRTYETLVFAGNNFWGFQHDCFRNGSNDDVIYFKKVDTIK